MLISPTWAFQDLASDQTMGSGTKTGGILPLIVILAVFLIALYHLGRKRAPKRKRRGGSRGNKR